MAIADTLQSLSAHFFDYLVGKGEAPDQNSGGQKGGTLALPVSYLNDAKRVWEASLRIGHKHGKPWQPGRCVFDYTNIQLQNRRISK
jgi:hypothetical protein